MSGNVEPGKCNCDPRLGVTCSHCNRRAAKQGDWEDSYWDRTDRIEKAGATPNCQLCGEKMFAADDHGRFTCMCSIGRTQQL